MRVPAVRNVYVNDCVVAAANGDSSVNQSHEVAFVLLSVKTTGTPTAADVGPVKSATGFAFEITIGWETAS